MVKLCLASNGAANLPIVLTGVGNVAMQIAAKELAHFLKRITGADFAIVGDCDGAAIRLVVDPVLAEEAFHICCNESGLTISGGSDRGLHYGVVGFLEDVLGVRFYTHDVTKVPKCSELALDAIDITDAPAFEYRAIDYPLCSNAEWRVHNRINCGGSSASQFAGCNGREMVPFGGCKAYALYVHSFNALVNPEEYFDSHPEYFSLVNGQRLKNRTQLCLTNPEVIAIATENAKKILRKNPGASIISISQNDCYNPCECPECAKIDAENGSHAGSLLHFVNAVAAGIEEEFPHVVVDTLAYQYTRTPPSVIKPRHNVCVRLCSIECCFGHPMESCSHVASFANMEKTSGSTFQEDLVGWSKICDRIYIWDYVTNYAHYLMPFPNFHVIGPNMRYFAANGVKGVFEEGNGQSVSPDMTEMRTWLLAKLLWNPNFDVEKGIYEFTESVYGDAAPEIRAYIKLFEKRVMEGNVHFGIYDFPFIGYLDPATVEEAQKIVASAQAKNLTLSQRIYVERVALSIEYVVVAQSVLMGQKDLDRVDALLEKARTLGVTRISEWLDWYSFKRVFVDWDPTKPLLHNIASIASFADVTALADVEKVISM